MKTPGATILKKALHVFTFMYKRPGWVVPIALIQLVVILTVGYIFFKITEQATFNEFNQRQLVIAIKATEGIEHYFETIVGSLKAFGRAPEIHHFDDRQARVTLAREIRELKKYGVNDLGVLDAEGILRYSVMAGEIEGRNFSWRRYFKAAKAMNSRDSYIIQFIEFMGVEAGQKGVLIAIPLFESENGADRNSPSFRGEFAGVAVSTLKLDTVIQKFITPLKGSDRGQALLLDDRYNVLWEPDIALFGKNLLKEVEGFPLFRKALEGMRNVLSGTAKYSYYQFDASKSRFTNEIGDHLIAFAPVHLGKQFWTLGV